MAERRMFAKTIILSDAFLDMPMSARCLYFTLGMIADDDGFVNSPKSIMRQCGASIDDMNLLIAKKFVITFENGVVVIKHWRIHNFIRNDRYKETAYLSEKSELVLDEKGAYHRSENTDSVVGIPTVHQRYTEDRIGKDSLDKDIDIEPVKQVVDYLNKTCGTHYRASSASTAKHIKARLNEGYKLEDFIIVIDKKYSEWHNDAKMAQYLRPETLFGSKFEGYLNQPLNKPENKPKNKHNFEGRKINFDELEEIAFGKPAL